MDKIFIKDLDADSPVDTAFAVKNWSIRQKKNGEDYLSITLKDNSGELTAVVWDAVPAARKALEDSGYVWVSGRVGQFNDRKQITVQRIKPLTVDQINEEDFVTVSQNDIEEMFGELQKIVNAVGHLHLRKLLLSYLDDEKLMEMFRRAPAAMGFHHTFQGGLLDHTLSMMKLAEKVADHYALLDRDLLVTGVFLHDLAKTEELLYDQEYKYSDTGQLLGHIVMGVIDVEKRMDTFEFPRKLRNKVLHMIISHHGEEQYGSPKKPMLPEAIALNYIDLIDSRMEMARETLERSAGDEYDFTEWHRGLGVSLYKG